MQTLLHSLADAPKLMCKSLNNLYDAIPSPETVHYVIFFLPNWCVHRIILLLIIIQLTHRVPAAKLQSSKFSHYLSNCSVMVLH